MSTTPFHIRPATNEDHDQILAVHLDAFGNEDGEVIARLVAEMLSDASAAPLYSFVTEPQGGITGHVLFTAASIQPGGDTSAQILAPLAVRREMQGRGAGSQLVTQAFNHLRANNVELVFVLGYPSFYQRFGFQTATTHQLHSPYVLPPANVDAWMVKELKPGAIESNSGTVKCCDALDKPEYWAE